MPSSALGHTLIIANPTSHSGRGAQGAAFTERFLQTYENASNGFEVILTQEAGDASRIAREAHNFDSVVALGGDGIIHEVVNGLMELPKQARPALGIIAMGSGNDFARSIGAARNDVDSSLFGLVGGTKRCIDVGRVTSDENSTGAYFMETLSFGLDAAIAVDTSDRRSAGTTEHGEQLYVSSGLKILSSGSKGYSCRFSLDGGEPQQTRALIFAIQNGPTYGGGFKICPDAELDDGKFDICYNLAVPPLPLILGLFGLARFGKHTVSKNIVIKRAAKIAIEFDEEVPLCQFDGEQFPGSRFEVELCPSELEVIVP